MESTQTNQNIEPKIEVKAKSNKTLWIVIVILVLCICCIVTIAGSILFLQSQPRFYFNYVPNSSSSIFDAPISSLDDKDNIRIVLDKYMENMEARDTNGSYELFSIRAKSAFPESTLDLFLDGGNYELFKDYKDLTIEDITISNKLNGTNGISIEGEFATIKGTIEYSNGFFGVMDATLEKVDGVWGIQYVFVTIPPSKLNN